MFGAITNHLGFALPLPPPDLLPVLLGQFPPVLFPLLLPLLPLLVDLPPLFPDIVRSPPVCFSCLRRKKPRTNRSNLRSMPHLAEAPCGFTLSYMSFHSNGRTTPRGARHVNAQPYSYGGVVLPSMILCHSFINNCFDCQSEAIILSNWQYFMVCNTMFLNYKTNNFLIQGSSYVFNVRVKE